MLEQAAAAKVSTRPSDSAAPPTSNSSQRDPKSVTVGDRNSAACRPPAGSAARSVRSARTTAGTCRARARERDLDDQQVVGAQERRGRSPGDMCRRASGRQRARRSRSRRGRGRRSSRSAGALRADARQRAVEAVAEPVQREQRNHASEAGRDVAPAQKQTPTPSIARAAPRTVRWSELTAAAARSAIQISRRFSTPARTLVFTLPASSDEAARGS